MPEFSKNKVSSEESTAWLTTQIQEHYRRCALLYTRWSGVHAGGYHFGFAHHLAEYFDNSKMVANATQAIFDSLTIPTHTPWHALDAGCGSGEVARLFKKRYPAPTHTIVGVTLSEEQVTQGTSLLSPPALSGITLTQGDFHHLPFPAATFDAVLFINSICYSPGGDKIGALQEAVRVLKPGGKIVFYDVLLAQPPLQFPFWWRYCNQVLLKTWRVPEWSESEKIASTTQSLGLRMVFEKDFKWAIVPSVLAMAVLHIPWFFWQALRGKIPWHETDVLLRLITTAPVVGIHPAFHHPIIVWEKQPE